MTTSPPRLPKPSPPSDHARLPSRGIVLCIFEDHELVQSIEPSITNSGFTLLRARHGMHGYWMAITGRPDVIVTDISEPERESNYLLDCLKRNAKTCDIPVIALVDARQQESAKVSCLRHATVCLTRDISHTDLLQQVSELVEKSQTRPTLAIRHEASPIDAYFSQLGHATRRMVKGHVDLPSSPVPHKKNHRGSGRTAHSRVPLNAPLLQP